MGEGFKKKTRGEDCKEGPRFESASALLWSVDTIL